MKNLQFYSVFTAIPLILTLFYSQSVLAQCNVVNTTPAGGEVVVCAGQDNNGLTTTDQADDITIETNADIINPGNHVIQTLEGNDKVLMRGGSIFTSDNDDNCIRFGSGENEFHMIDGNLDCGHCVSMSNDDGSRAKIIIEDGTLRGDDECIDTGGLDDEIYIRGGDLRAGDAVIMASPGNDKVMITGGRLTQLDDSDETVETGSGNDLISVKNAIVDGRLAEERHAIAGGSNDDTVRLGTGAQILGLSSGDGGFDTLVFEMAVPEKFINDICANILAQNPAEGQINITGLFYEWEDFEVLLCELVPSEPRPIPTLSQWGLIAMAVLIGIAGIIFYRRRTAQA